MKNQEGLILEFKNYMITENDAKDTTIKNYIGSIVKLLDFIGIEDITEINNEKVRSYVSYVRNIYTSKNTINPILSAVKLFCKMLVSEYSIGLTVDIKIKSPTANEVNHHKTPTSDETFKIGDYCYGKAKGVTDFKRRLACMLIIFGGYRNDELINLEWSNIDYERKIIKISKAKNDEVREVPINEDIICRLSQLKDVYKEKGYNANKYILLNKFGEKISSQTLCNYFLTASEELGFKLIPHSTRKAMATMYFNSNVDLINIQKMLGHKDLKTTQLYVNPDSKVEIVGSENILTRIRR